MTSCYDAISWTCLACAYRFSEAGRTADNPAPAVVTSHGYLNNKEMQDLNYVELARRGFVAFAIKLYKKTGNVWIAGLINAMVVTMPTVANTSFSFPC